VTCSVEKLMSHVFPVVEIRLLPGDSKMSRTYILEYISDLGLCSTLGEVKSEKISENPAILFLGFWRTPLIHELSCSK